MKIVVIVFVALLVTIPTFVYGANYVTHSNNPAGGGDTSHWSTGSHSNGSNYGSHWTYGGGRDMNPGYHANREYHTNTQSGHSQIVGQTFNLSTGEREKVNIHTNPKK